MIPLCEKHLQSRAPSFAPRNRGFLNLRRYSCRARSRQTLLAPRLHLAVGRSRSNVVVRPPAESRAMTLNHGQLDDARYPAYSSHINEAERPKA